MAKIDAFVAYIESQVKQAPIEVIRQKLRDTLAEFLTKTRVYTVDLGTVSIVASTHTYSLRTVTPEGFLVAELPRAWYNDGRIWSRSNEEIARLFGQDWKTRTAVEPVYYTRPTPQEIRLFAIPTTAVSDGLLCEAVLKTSPDAREVPDWIYEEYREGIAHGALMRLYGQLHTPWGSANAKEQEQRQYNNALGVAAERGTRTDSDTVPVVRAVGFGGIVDPGLELFDETFELE